MDVTRTNFSIDNISATKLKIARKKTTNRFSPYPPSEPLKIYLRSKYQECLKIISSSTRNINQYNATKLANDFYQDLINAIKKSDVNWDTKLSNQQIPINEFHKRNIFFIIASPKISILLNKITNSNIAFTKVSKEIINLINKSTELTENEKYFFTSLISSIEDYHNIIEYLNANLKLADINCNEYIKNIYKQFIEGDALYKNFTDYKKDVNDLGAFIFDSYFLYINRCLLAWIYAVDKLIIKSEPLTINILTEIGSFFGSQVSKQSMQYGAFFEYKESEQLVNVLADGTIYNFIDYTNKTDIPPELQKNIKLQNGIFRVTVNKDFLENYINKKLHGITIKLAKEKNYFFIDKIIKQKNNKLTIISCNSIRNRSPYVYKISHVNNGFSLQIEFNTKLADKPTYINKTIDKFNIEFASANSEKNKTIAILRFAIEMQKIHMLNDSNGRLYCIIVATMLHKLNLWLTRHPFKLWTLIEGYDVEKLALIYLKLCVPIPKINSSCNSLWFDATTNIKEKLRIICALGDQQRLEQILTDDPKLLSSSIPMEELYSLKKPLAITLLHDQKNLSKYLKLRTGKN